MSLVIDGRYGEGGGQILRTALALSAILGQPMEIHHIRAGRKKPGLRPQHLASVKAVALTTLARTEGTRLGSTHLFFEPRTLQGGHYELDVGTAGSTCLVLQAMMPGLFFADAPSQVTMKGGTHVPWSPCFHYLKEVFLHTLKAMNAIASVRIENWGWYPKGGGRQVGNVFPAAAGFRGLQSNGPGALRDLAVLSGVSNLPASIGERQKDRVLRRLAQKGYRPSEAKIVEAPSPGTGTVVFLKARFENSVAGFSSLGARGKRAETVADEAVDGFFAFVTSKATVDCYLADQLVLYMALAKGPSRVVVQAVSKHLLTNIWVIEQFVPVTFQVDEASRTVCVEGVGWKGPSTSRRASECLAGSND